jgi:hypothetical protein
MSHWTKNFFENFKTLYGADVEQLNKKWHYHGSLKNKADKGNNIHLLKTPLPEYTSSCICGHYINENCIVSNGKYSCVVGNCCVKKFMPVAMDEILQIKENKKKSKKICRSVIKNHIKNINKLKSDIETAENKSPRFGKYKNKKWKDVPDNYIKWCVNKGIWFDYDIEQYIKYRIN